MYKRQNRDLLHLRTTAAVPIATSAACKSLHTLNGCKAAQAVPAHSNVAPQGVSSDEVTPKIFGHMGLLGCVLPVVASQSRFAKEVMKHAAQTLDVAPGRSLRVWIEAPVLGMT